MYSSEYLIDDLEEIYVKNFDDCYQQINLDNYSKWINDSAKLTLDAIKKTNSPYSIYCHGTDFKASLDDSIFLMKDYIISSNEENSYLEFFNIYKNETMTFSNELSIIKKNNDYSDQIILWLEYNIKLSYIKLFDLGLSFKNDTINEQINKEFESLIKNIKNDYEFNLNCNLLEDDIKVELNKVLEKFKIGTDEIVIKEKKRSLIPLIIGVVLFVIGIFCAVEIPSKIKELDYDVKKLDIETEEVTVTDNGSTYVDRYSMDIVITVNNGTKGDIISTTGVLLLEDQDDNLMLSVNVALPRINSGETQVVTIPLTIENSYNLESVFSNLNGDKLYFEIYKLDFNNSYQTKYENVDRKILLKTFDDEQLIVNENDSFNKDDQSASDFIDGNLGDDHGRSQLVEVLKQIDEQIEINGWYYYQSGTIDNFDYSGTETDTNTGDLYEIWTYNGETPYEINRYCIQIGGDNNIYYDCGFLDLVSTNGELITTFDDSATETLDSNDQVYVTYKHDESGACTISIVEDATGVGCEYYDDEMDSISHLVLLKKLNIRNGAGTNYELVGIAEAGSMLPYYEIAQADGYTWYKISDTNNKWVADDGTWVTVVNR